MNGIPIHRKAPDTFTPRGRNPCRHGENMTHLYTTSALHTVSPSSTLNGSPFCLSVVTPTKILCRRLWRRVSRSDRVPNYTYSTVMCRSLTHAHGTNCCKLTEFISVLCLHGYKPNPTYLQRDTQLSSRPCLCDCDMNHRNHVHLFIYELACKRGAFTMFS